ncbi:alpha/beta fold hydrolase [Candidatus Woesearchaeota archaeon]|nr:alpha/beta fold hydrolase [Candidatus Woesearchaeota archaeon]
MQTLLQEEYVILKQTLLQITLALPHIAKELPSLTHNVYGFGKRMVSGNRIGTPENLRHKLYDGIVDRKTEDETNPLLILPGFMQKRECLERVERYFGSNGHTGKTFVVDLPVHDGISLNAERLAEDIDYIKRNSGYQQVSLLGYSMGGVQARKVLQEDKSSIDNVVTLGAPHFGTLLATAAVNIEHRTRMVEHEFAMKVIQLFGMGGKCVEELRYGSAFLLELAKKDTDETLAKIINLYSKTDLIIIPYSSSILEGARNIEIESAYGIKGVGHQRLVFNQTLYRKIGELFEVRN